MTNIEEIVEGIEAKLEQVMDAVMGIGTDAKNGVAEEADDAMDPQDMDPQDMEDMADDMDDSAEEDDEMDDAVQSETGDVEAGDAEAATI